MQQQIIYIAEAMYILGTGRGSKYEDAVSCKQVQGLPQMRLVPARVRLFEAK